jgi:hypothetical protein
MRTVRQINMGKVYFRSPLHFSVITCIRTHFCHPHAAQKKKATARTSAGTPSPVAVKPDPEDVIAAPPLEALCPGKGSMQS